MQSLKRAPHWDRGRPARNERRRREQVFLQESEAKAERVNVRSKESVSTGPSEQVELESVGEGRDTSVFAPAALIAGETPAVPVKSWRPTVTE